MADTEIMHQEWMEHHQREAEVCADMARLHEGRALFHGVKVREFMQERHEYEFRLASLSSDPFAQPFSDDLERLTRLSDVVSDGGSTHFGGPSTSPCR